MITTAERGLFDAFFLGEGLRLRESDGHIHDLDIAGRPDAITQLAALAAITDRIGLVATQNTTFNEPATWPTGSPGWTCCPAGAPAGTS
jgi:alkanesulfonate monooxygenase SsuD/methylene tetrahydromethanopterin reductase-like flavin-dependent oxidoreductase (luciferase family)